MRTHVDEMKFKGDSFLEWNSLPYVLKTNQKAMAEYFSLMDNKFYLG